MVLLIFVRFASAPITEKISFLDVNVRGHITHFGVFGFTGSARSVGYRINSAVLGLPNTTLEKLINDAIHGLTFALILHPLAAGLSALAVLFGLCGAAYSRAGTILMTFAATLATIITLIAWIIDMVLWSAFRSRIRAEVQAVGSPSAQYGNAIWLTLVALLALLLASCAGALGSCGRFSRKEK
ncbi:pali-domain-containing protein [Gautieria morchelliformis]|nr:pali-domain-containing protein [Gautieria morchelliformis]